MKKDDETIRKIFDFFGGRTNAVKLFHRTADDFPWVSNNCLYPGGYPIVIYEPEGTNISTYFGVVHCKILPPSSLCHPVSPYRSGGKLTFPLCRKCVETEQLKPLNE